MSIKTEIPRLAQTNYSIWKSAVTHTQIHAANGWHYISKNIEPNTVDGPENIKSYWTAALLITSSVSSELAYLVTTESDERSYNPSVSWAHILRRKSKQSIQIVPKSTTLGGYVLIWIEEVFRRKHLCPTVNVKEEV